MEITGVVGSVILLEGIISALRCLRKVKKRSQDDFKFS